MTDRLVSAVPVPFTADGGLDRPALESVLAGLEPHVDAVLMAGTTGEFPALADDERLAVVATAVEVLGAPRVVAHVGHGSAHQVLALAGRVRDLGVDRLALLSPYYLPTDDAGAVAFFAALSQEQGDATLYAYLFPERTGHEVGPHVLGEVLRLPGFSGVKLSGGAADRRSSYAAVVPDGQQLWSGDDATFPQVVADGGTGVVSGVSSAFPGLFASLAAAVEAGDSAETERLQQDVVTVVRLVGPTVARLKAALAVRTGSLWGSRMSLPAVDSGLRGQIAEAVARHG